jgi:hypothetical protein
VKIQNTYDKLVEKFHVFCDEEVGMLFKELKAVDPDSIQAFLMYMRTTLKLKGSTLFAKMSALKQVYLMPPHSPSPHRFAVKSFDVFVFDWNRFKAPQCRFFDLHHEKWRKVRVSDWFSSMHRRTNFVFF